MFSEASTLRDNETAAEDTADPHWDNQSGAEPITRTTVEQPHGPEW
ncbi:hypothetical protein [Nocardia brasiliensis]|nr:hypothetical protein [Nocardia brasiliensis]